MRIATWNIQKGLQPNWAAVEALDVDAITVQECGPGTREFVETMTGWSCAWQQGRYRKGVAVLARAPYRVEVVEAQEPCWLMTMIEGPERFRFVGFWAMSPTSADDGYPSQAAQLIERLPVDGSPTVLAGDFNASFRNAHHLQNVERLRERGLVSAYHARRGVPNDAWEGEATSFHQWRQDKPFHMDYLFLPATWTIHDVMLGGFDEYARAGGISDHMPIVATVTT